MVKILIYIYIFSPSNSDSSFNLFTMSIIVEHTKLDPINIHQEVRQSNWLSTPGPYRDYVASLCSLNPTLETADRSNTWAPLIHRRASMTILEIREKKPPLRVDIASSIKLQLYYSNPEMQDDNKFPRRRIHIFEGICPDFASVLGDKFTIDPSFFVDQERTSISEVQHEGVRMLSSLLSSSEPDKQFIMKYFEVRHLSAVKPKDSPICERTGKSIVVQNGFSKSGTIGIVHQATSLWLHQDGKNWDGEYYEFL